MQSKMSDGLRKLWRTLWTFGGKAVGSLRLFGLHKNGVYERWSMAEAESSAFVGSVVAKSSISSKSEETCAGERGIEHVKPAADLGSRVEGEGRSPSETQR
eukprot:GFKZ01006475.1.p2 GENE.GFKZ01006475.1~~GFKZ01006475.1.p2  ORF type:complete len:101 (-),score=11.22 GFKZ01006475.1:1063-1365(-)